MAPMVFIQNDMNWEVVASFSLWSSAPCDRQIGSVESHINLRNGGVTTEKCWSTTVCHKTLRLNLFRQKPTPITGPHRPPKFYDGH